MIFEINFFLFSFALSNIWSYTCVYAKYYANVSNVEFGTLAMILPTLALLAKPTVCSMADAHTMHKQFLVGALGVFALAYGSLGVLPYVKDPQDHSTDGIAWIVICIIMSIGYISVGCIFCMNDALASNYARKHNKSYGRMRIYACVGWASGAALVMIVGEVSWLPFRVLGCLILVLCTLLDILIILLWPYAEDFEMFHDGSTADQRKVSIVGPNTMALLASGADKTANSLSISMLERLQTGRSKSVGGLPNQQQRAASLAAEEQTDSSETAAAVLKFVKATSGELDGGNQRGNDVVVGNNKKEHEKEYSNFQCQLILIKMIASRHKSFIRYIVLFTFYGIIQSMIWNYQLDYFKARVAKDDAEFEFISTLSMMAQSVGEISINIVAAQMLKAFGSNANLSLALVSIGLRSFFYSNLLPYLGANTVVLAEFLQGPSLGLYWVLTVDIGGNFALMVTDYLAELKKRGIVRDRRHEEELSGCLRATMIGIMSSSMEGLGVALGSIFGGFISSSLGYNSMWNLCAAIGFIAGFLNLGWDLTTKLLLKRRNNNSSSRSPHSMGSNMNDSQDDISSPKVVVEGPVFQLSSKATKL